MVLPNRSPVIAEEYLKETVESVGFIRRMQAYQKHELSGFVFRTALI
jgi:hypothetical protein